MPSLSASRAILEEELNRYKQRKNHSTHNRLQNHHKHHSHYHKQTHHDELNHISEHDDSVLQNFREKIVENALQSYQQEYCFKDYNEFIKTCPPYIKTNAELDFENFKVFQQSMPKNLKRYFTAKAFIFLRPSEGGTVPTEDFLK